MPLDLAADDVADGPAPRRVEGVSYDPETFTASRPSKIFPANTTTGSMSAPEDATASASARLARPSLSCRVPRIIEPVTTTGTGQFSR